MHRCCIESVRLGLKRLESIVAMSLDSEGSMYIDRNSGKLADIDGHLGPKHENEHYTSYNSGVSLVKYAALKDAMAGQCCSV
jgi:hypothetical protein